MVKKNNVPFIIWVIIVFGLSTYNCENQTGDKVYTGLTGAYSCQENSVYSGYKKYIIEIDKVKSQEDLFIISNFHNQGNIEFLYATYKNDSIFIENQVISGLFINGKGSVNQNFNNIEIFYHTDDGNTEMEYFAVYSR